MPSEVGMVGVNGIVDSQAIDGVAVGQRDDRDAVDRSPKVARTAECTAKRNTLAGAIIVEEVVGVLHPRSLRMVRMMERVNPGNEVACGVGHTNHDTVALAVGTALGIEGNLQLAEVGCKLRHHGGNTVRVGTEHQLAVTRGFGPIVPTHRALVVPAGRQCAVGTVEVLKVGHRQQVAGGLNVKVAGPQGVVVAEVAHAEHIVGGGVETIHSIGGVVDGDGSVPSGGAGGTILHHEVVIRRVVDPGQVHTVGSRRCRQVGGIHAALVLADIDVVDVDSIVRTAVEAESHIVVGVVVHRGGIELEHLIAVGAGDREQGGEGGVVEGVGHHAGLEGTAVNVGPEADINGVTIEGHLAGGNHIATFKGE